MLEKANAIPTIGVKDLARAREFYQSKLGLIPLEGDEHVQIFKSGEGTVEIYKSEFAGTNRATSMTWALGESLREEVESLKKKGVIFEHYDMPGSHLEGDIHVMDQMKV